MAVASTVLLGHRGRGTSPRCGRSASTALLLPAGTAPRPRAAASATTKVGGERSSSASQSSKSYGGSANARSASTRARRRRRRRRSRPAVRPVERRAWRCCRGSPTARRGRARRTCSASAPRDSASMPSAPVPANRSATGASTIDVEAGERVEHGLAHLVGGRPRSTCRAGGDQPAPAELARHDAHARRLRVGLWRVLEPDPVITCIDCGGRAHLLTPPDPDPRTGASCGSRATSSPTAARTASTAGTSSSTDDAPRRRLTLDHGRRFPRTPSARSIRAQNRGTVRQLRGRSRRHARACGIFGRCQERVRNSASSSVKSRASSSSSTG